MILNYFNRPTVLVISAIVMVFALIFHNMFQAWLAARFGDRSAKLSGFMNFEPQQHLEPFGVLFLFLLGFGWPKTIPVNGRNLTRRQEVIVWYGGPLAYLIVAFVSLLLGVVLDALGGSLELSSSFLVAASFAILHAVINLFPVFPLDGAHAALAWGNADVRRMIQQIQSWGLIGFILVFFVLSWTGILGAIQGFFMRLFLTVIGSIPGL